MQAQPANGSLVFLSSAVRLLVEGPRCCQRSVRFSSVFVGGSHRLREERRISSGLGEDALRELLSGVERSITNSERCEFGRQLLLFSNGYASELLSELNPRH